MQIKEIVKESLTKFYGLHQVRQKTLCLIRNSFLNTTATELKTVLFYCYYVKTGSVIYLAFVSYSFPPMREILPNAFKNK